MSNHQARALYNRLADIIDSEHVSVSVGLEAIELLGQEWEDRKFESIDSVSWSPDTPIDAVGYEAERL